MPRRPNPATIITASNKEIKRGKEIAASGGDQVSDAPLKASEAGLNVVNKKTNLSPAAQARLDAKGTDLDFNVNALARKGAQKLMKPKKARVNIGAISGETRFGSSARKIMSPETTSKFEELVANYHNRTAGSAPAEGHKRTIHSMLRTEGAPDIRGAMKIPCSVVGCKGTTTIGSNLGSGLTHKELSEGKNAPKVPHKFMKAELAATGQEEGGQSEGYRCVGCTTAPKQGSVDLWESMGDTEKTREVAKTKVRKDRKAANKRTAFSKVETRNLNDKKPKNK
jgi:hypothetical protein